MAVIPKDLDAILRRLRPGLTTQTPGFTGIGNQPASGGGLQGLPYTGGGGNVGGTGINPTYQKPPVGGFAGFRPLDPATFGSVDDMAFDANYATNFDALQRQLASGRSELDLQNQQDEEEYARAQRDTQTEFERSQGELTDKLANQGILRSGIHTKAQGDLGSSVQRRLADFERQKTEGAAGRQRNFSQFQQSIQDQVAQLQAEKTRRQMEKEQEMARQNAESLAASQPQITENGSLIGGESVGSVFGPQTKMGNMMRLAIGRRILPVTQRERQTPRGGYATR